MKNSDDFFGASKRIPPKRKKALLEFCRPLGLHFKDLALLDLAFHHRSYSNEDSAYRHKNNERLEFLGDSVLGLVTATFLYKDMAENPEGDLAKMKGNVVSEKALAPVALEFGIDKMLVLGKGEESGGGRKKPAILADCMEAVRNLIFFRSPISKVPVISVTILRKQLCMENPSHSKLLSIEREYISCILNM